MNRWTEEQKRAIETRNCDLLISAAAGSGKTAVLVERVIQRILAEGGEIDRLLVVTFTRAAASEMSQRIGAALAASLAKTPEDVHLQNQITLLPRADIKTIHSFCLQVIKEFYHLLDIDPAVKTADQSEMKLLKYEVLEDIFEELYAKEEEWFFVLLETFGEATKDTRLKELILKLYAFAQGYPDPKRLLHESAENFHLSEQDTLDSCRWISMIKESIYQNAKAASFLLKEAKTLAEQTVGFEGYAECLEIECVGVENLIASLSGKFSDWRLAWVAIDFGRLPSYRGKDNQDIKKRIQFLRDEAKAIINKKMKEQFFAFSEEKQLEFIHRLYPIAKGLTDLTILFMDEFAVRKREKNVIDFNDYEHFALEILVAEGSTVSNVIPTEAARQMQQRYDEVMIDEYQDSNLVQEMILSAVSKESIGENNRFMVGDVKQSIYRFRLAMPELFNTKYNTYPSEAGGKTQKIVLSKNFRSRKNVLDGINFIFYQIMGAQFGEIEYDSEAALYAGATFPAIENEKNELILIETQTKEEIEEELEDKSQMELEAMAVARKIRQMMEDGFEVVDKQSGALRKMEYRDVAVLMRSVKSWGTVLDDVFGKEGVPYYAEVAEGYFDVQEVDTVLNLLALIDNPRQDIPLIATLYSPLYRLTADDLMQIRLSGPNMQYYDCVLEYIQTGEEKRIVEVLTALQADLARWRKAKRDISLYELLCLIYQESGYYAYVGMNAGGGLRQANLRLLLEKAEQFETGRQKGVFSFIRYVAELKTAEDESSSAKLQSEADNLVRVMTIHKSKGLEFPIVFVVGMGKQFNRQENKESVVTHAAWGYGMSYTDLENRATYKTLSQTALREAIRLESLAEELRVLYVALTRAKEKLIIMGAVKDFPKALQSWCMSAATKERKLPLFRLQWAKNYLDWIVPSLLRHEEIQIDEALDEELPTPTTIADESHWSVSFLTKGMLQRIEQNEREQAKAQELVLERLDTERDYSGCKDEIFRKLDWQYAHKTATALPVKISISEVKRKHMEQSGESYPYPPMRFAFPEKKADEKTKLNRAQIGTAIHMVMERADFKKAYGLQDVSSLIQRLADDGQLTEEESKAIPKKDIVQFFKSDIAKRMQGAKRVEKEKNFSMLVKPSEIFTEEKYSEMDEQILINGIIDCYFVEQNDEVVLVDYKSDRVSEESVFIERYAIQLRLYKLALERALNTSVSEVYIYSFALGREIRVMV